MRLLRSDPLDNVCRYVFIIFQLFSFLLPPPSLFPFASESFTDLQFLFLFLVISLPMFFFHDFFPIVLYDEEELWQRDSALCVSLKKWEMSIYYGIASSVIYWPLFSVFVWFYYNIARLIWRHRKPISQPTKSCISKKEKCENKKIRSFKVVIFLVIPFVLCRFPYQTMFLFYKFYESGDSSYVDSLWNLYFSLTCLNVFNCGLNPFLYTYLHQTISGLQFTEKLIRKVFCLETVQVQNIEKPKLQTKRVQFVIDELLQK